VGRVLALSDWLLLAAIVIGMPVYAYFRSRSLQAGGVPDRSRLYARSIAMLWLLGLITLYAWYSHGRPFEGLGFTFPPGTETTASEVVCAMAAVAIVLRLRKLAAWPAEKITALRERIGGTALVIPRTRSELTWFFGVAVTAGVCEELLYRGFFFAVTAPFITAYGSIAASAVVFGLAHAYQGRRGILLTGAIGVFLGAFYFLSGSIVWPMLLHALIDVNGGVSGYLLLREPPSVALVQKVAVGREDERDA
jgi:uncharacterized protein